LPVAAEDTEELAAAATAAAAKGAPAAFFLRTSFVDGESAAAEVDAVQLLDRGLGLFRRAHGDERETAGAAGHLVHGDVHISHGTELAKSRAQLVFRRVERHIADVEFRITHSMIS
jgi:hypothetical protein